MQNHHPISRRALVKSSIFGTIAISIPNVFYAKNGKKILTEEKIIKEKNPKYPSIEDTITEELVGASHFDFEKVKMLVDKRPELARATWDWGFGDWESALGAASHVGRRDIATYLINKGARANIFTLAMLGHFQAVRTMVEAIPGIQSLTGPHGISLLSHAKAGTRSDSLTSDQRKNSALLIEYLEELGDADPQMSNIAMTEVEKQAYLGDYKYADGPADGFSVRLNMRKMISLGKLGKFGGALFQIEPGVFAYNGTSTVRITFQKEEDTIVSLQLDEPGLTIRAVKITT